jgi:hypothetical protein
MTRQIIVYAIIFGFIPAGLIAALIGGMFDHPTDKKVVPVVFVIAVAVLYGPWRGLF